MKKRIGVHPLDELEKRKRLFNALATLFDVNFIGTYEKNIEKFIKACIEKYAKCDKQPNIANGKR